MGPPVPRTEHLGGCGRLLPLFYAWTAGPVPTLVFGTAVHLRRHCAEDRLVHLHVALHLLRKKLCSLLSSLISWMQFEGSELLSPFSLQTLSDNNFGGCHLPKNILGLSKSDSYHSLLFGSKHPSFIPQNWLSPSSPKKTDRHTWLLCAPHCACMRGGTIMSMYLGSEGTP